MRKNNNRAIVHALLAILFLISIIVFVVSRNVRHKRSEVKISNVYFGIDGSHHQGTDITWDSIANKHKVKFVIWRATRGAYYRDSTFLKNFAEAKSRGYKVGAYHYLSSKQPLDSQAMNYMSVSSILIRGDFRPIIDIEEGDSTAKNGDPMITDSLRRKIKWLLDTITMKHGVTPILYMSLNFYKNNFKKDTAFSKYPRWLAAYGDSKKDYFDDPDVKRSAIHQFTDKVSISGIKGKVDGNNIPKKVFGNLLLKK